MIREISANPTADDMEPYIDWWGAPTPYTLVEKYGYDWQDELGEDAYPIWDESMREWLNSQIYSYFMYREIGQETGETFFRWMRLRMNQIMPVINPIAAFALGKTAASDDWRLVAEIVTESGNKYKGTTSATSTENTATGGSNVTEVDNSTTAKASNLTSETPQTQLSGNENYMTGLVESGSKSDGTSRETQKLGSTVDTATSTNSAFDQTNDANSDEKHYEGLAAEVAQRWLEAAPDILGNIYAGLESLFVQVW